MQIPVLENEIVKLSPLTLDNYQKIIDIASEKDLVEYSPSHINTPEKLKKYTEIALNKFENKTVMTFIIFDKRTKKYAGSTRFMNIDWANKVLEIGSTWLGRDFHGSGLNTNIKHLMINHVFNAMEFEKIEFRIDERNIRSRKAVENLGGVLEGILKKNVYLKDGFKRNTCCYGILKEEWKL